MKREIIRIDEDKCTGCELCIPNCPEGAIQVIDGKARLVSDLFCDGLGACLGHCPEGAITIEKREAQAYDESLVMENVVKQGENTVRAHLQHLKDHGEEEYLKQAMKFLKERDMDITIEKEPASACGGGCPGSRELDFDRGNERGASQSRLGHWPVQLHLVSPLAPSFSEKDVLLAADCVAYATGGFHERFLAGKSIAIACPKLDSGKEIYLDKIRALVDHAKINTLTVITMEVPCCSGLLSLAEEALESAARRVPLKHIVISVKGEVLKSEWLVKNKEASRGR